MNAFEISLLFAVFFALGFFGSAGMRRYHAQGRAPRRLPQATGPAVSAATQAGPAATFEATAYRLLRSIYLRAICRATSRNPERVTPEEQNMLLEPHDREIQHDFARLREILRYAHTTGAEAVLRVANEQPDVDHEMLDQAVKYKGWEGDK